MKKLGEKRIIVCFNCKHRWEEFVLEDELNEVSEVYRTCIRCMTTARFSVFPPKRKKGGANGEVPQQG